MKISNYYYKKACLSKEQFQLAIKAAKENAREEERERLLAKLKTADFRGVEANMEWLGKPLEGYTAITYEAFVVIQKLYSELETLTNQ